MGFTFTSKQSVPDVVLPDKQVLRDTYFGCCCCCSCQETTRQGLSGEASDPQVAAARQQGCAVLRDVLSKAFAEADPQVRTRSATGSSCCCCCGLAPRLCSLSDVQATAGQHSRVQPQSLHPTAHGLTGVLPCC